MFALRHPTRGLWLVDTGVAKELRDHPSDVGFGWLVARAAHLDKLTVRNALGPWLTQQGVPLADVLLTHLHIDHISGVPDVPRSTPIYAGPNETKARSAQNLVLSGSIDGLLEGQTPLSQWQFAADTDGKFSGILDVFGHATVFAVHVPDHTAGSTVYVVRTPQGAVLLTGDTCHTRWGWENGVEPGDYTDDRPANALQLSKLKELVARHPRMIVRLGHQL
ncbi:MAG: MBL fold metallo-hydrolase [Myxococcales bacterium]|nr:MBL fold metallo-hydrolase [Myxococcales bacterium]